jgi:hypothetical protein
MDSQDVNPRAERQAATLISLLKEYTDKLNQLRARARAFMTPSALAKLDAKSVELERISFQDEHLRLIPALDQLMRESARMIEHGVIDDITRLEMEVRLAEFEGVYWAFQHQKP